MGTRTFSEITSFLRNLDEDSRRIAVQKDYVGIPVRNPRVRLPEKDLQSRGEYHITIFSPDEMHELMSRKGWTAEKLKDELEGVEIEGEPKYVCLGKQEKDDNAVYYVVVRWSEAQEFRRRYGFDKTDLHVTLGFRTSDIHNVRKDSSTCIGKLREDVRETAAETEIILLDVDGTLVDVSERAARSMKDIGVKVSPEEWEDVYATFDWAKKDKFLRIFLSDKYTHMDRPYNDVFQFVKRLVNRTSLPVVVLTGRPEEMGHTGEVDQMLLHQGIPVREVIARGEGEERTKTAGFKVRMVQQRGYKPVHIFDDDPRNLVAFATEWPEASIYRIDRGKIRKYRTKRMSEGHVLVEKTIRKRLDIEVPSTVMSMLQAIRDAGGLGMIIGGAVRDAILGKPSKDIDIEVYGLPGDKLQQVLGKFGKVNLVGKSFGIYKIRVGGRELDVSIPRAEKKSGVGHRGFDVSVDHTMSYQDAARRRDFTINTLGYDPLDGVIFNPHGGMEDLSKGVIRMTDPGAFRDDPLRVLRMAQFSSRFGFDIDPETMRHAREAPELETLPAERNFEEFRKGLLRSKKPGAFIDALHNAEVIDRLFPELQGKEREIIDLLDRVVLHKTGKADNDLVLGFSAMAIVTDWSTASRFLNKLTKEVAIRSRVKNVHEAIAHLERAWPETDEEIRRWLSPIKESNLDVVRGLGTAKWGSRFEDLFDRAEPLIAQVRPIVLGRHLLDLGVPPGPRVGSLLKRLYDLQLKGEFSDLEGGLEAAKRLVAVAEGDDMSIAESEVQKAMAELTADRDYRALVPRERNFIENFLSTVTGDRFADGANFQRDLKSYGYKNVTRLLSIFQRLYPTFAQAVSTPKSEGKPLKVPQQEGQAALMGDLETFLEGLLDRLGWKPTVHVYITKWGLRAELEDWQAHDPSVGAVGGREAYVTFDVDGDELNTKWTWADHVGPERRANVESMFGRKESEIRDLVASVLGD